MLNDNNDIESIFDGDLDFKPLTKGLGFHHSVKDKKEVSQSLIQKSMELKSDLESRATILNNNSNHAISTNMGDLSPFYEAKRSESTISANNLKIQIQDDKEAAQMFENLLGKETGERYRLIQDNAERIEIDL